MKIVFPFCLGLVLAWTACAEPQERWCNIAADTKTEASSELGKLKAIFLTDGERGKQSRGSYWNDATQGKGPDAITLSLPNPTKIREIRLLSPTMDVSGPFAIKNVSVDILAGGEWRQIRKNITLIAYRQGPEEPTVTVAVPDSPVVSKIRVTFEDPIGNDEGWNFLGEIEVIGWGVPAPRKKTAEDVAMEKVPDTIEAAAAWLHVKAFEMIRASRREMHDGIAAFPPQVGSGYGAFWLRDYAYMLEGCIDAFSFDELEDACRLFVDAQRDDGAMVDTVKYDGTPIYRPGFGRMGENPVADGSQFTVDVAWYTFQRTQNKALLIDIIDRLIRGMEVVPRNPENGLVHIVAGNWDRCPYGFTDSVRKQGDILFCSLLFVQASRQLADLCDALDRAETAKTWRTEAERVVASARATFWDADTGLFRAATVKCREHDIWGSAFAVYLDVASPEQAQAIAAYFRDHYGQISKRGQLRHTPGNVWWEQACGREVYQNGAYWATPVGWFVYTLDLVSPELADKTVLDMIRDFIELGDVNECINDDYANVKAYIASAALPLDGIRAMLRRRSPNKQ